MRDGIHPDYHEITITMTDGTEFVTRSTYGEPGAKILLDIDSKSHPAWTGLHRMIDRGGQLAKFNKRFQGLNGEKSPKSEGAPAAPVEKIKLTTSGKKKN